MAVVSVKEAAEEFGVSEARVRQMIAAGQIHAERIAGRWAVDLASLPARAQIAGRPMAPRIAWALILHADNPADAGWLRGDEASRLRKRIRIQRDAPDLLPRLRAWLAARAEVRHLHAQDPARLLSDPRIAPSGLSDSRSGISAPNQVEGYVHSADLVALMQDHLLAAAPPSRANTIVRVTNFMPPVPVPPLLVAVDLADRGGPREYVRAQQMLEEQFAAARGAST